MTSPPARFSLRPRMEASLDRIGAERQPVLTIARAMDEPEALVDHAARAVRFDPAWGPRGGYPGLRAPAPPDYVEALVRTLGPLIARAFGLGAVELAKTEASFSLVTLPPERLAPLQRIPHVDTTDPLQFAVLHYLCDDRFGGTAFYRHRATGFETLSPERTAAFGAARDREVAQAQAQARYIVGDTAHYQRVGAVDAAFDRIVVYRSRSLHSGIIEPGAPLSEDPRTGRLTANIFVSYRPA